MDSSKLISPSISRLTYFSGGTARLWHFTPTHDTIFIKMDTEGRSAFLALSGCNKLTLRSAWLCNNPRIVVDPLDCDSPIHFKDDSGIDISCTGAVLQEADPWSEYVLSRPAQSRPVIK